MRILITNYRLVEFGGSETFTYTIARELSKRHKILIWTPVWGKTLRDKFSLFSQTYNKIPKDFDVAHIHHRDCAEILQNINKPKVMLLHSPGKDYQENPIMGMQKYLAVSEETQTFLKQQGYDSEIIRNPIDTERFKSVNPVNKQVKTILILSNHFGYFKLVANFILSLNIKLLTLGMFIQDFKVEDWINRADLVVTIGRGCYESMSCGREVIIMGNFGIDGLASKSYMESREYNCSGRWKGEMPIEKVIKHLIETANTNNNNRDLILKYHDVKNIAKQLEEIYSKVILRQ